MSKIVATIATLLLIDTAIALPTTNFDSKINQECATSIEGLKTASLNYQRCIQRVGGKEAIKESLCSKEKQQKLDNEASLEKCKMMAAHKSIEKSLTEVESQDKEQDLG